MTVTAAEKTHSRNRDSWFPRSIGNEYEHRGVAVLDAVANNPTGAVDRVRTGERPAAVEKSFDFTKESVSDHAPGNDAANSTLRDVSRPWNARVLPYSCIRGCMVSEHSARHSHVEIASAFQYGYCLL